MVDPIDILSFITEYAWVFILLSIVIVGTLFIRIVRMSCYDMKESVHLLRNAEKTDGVSTIGAFFVALSTRMGAGNIIGISVAIIMGGIGSIFWMWVFSIFGASLCFAECTLGQIFKVREDDGITRGGPSFYIEKGLNNKKLAIFLAVIFVIGGMIFAGMETCNLNKSVMIIIPDSIFWINSIIIALVIFFLITRGVKKLTKFLSTLTPAIGGIWVIAVIVALVLNYQAIPETFVKIVQSGLDFQALSAGILGSFIIFGFKRGASSSEGGTGMVASVSSSADDSHPCVQGYVQSLGVFVDIFVICTATALLLLACGGNVPTDAEFALDYLSEALANGFMGDFGYVFLSAVIIFITLSSTLGVYALTESNARYIFGNNKKAMMAIAVIYCIVIFFLSMEKQAFVWELVDLIFVFMIGTNLYAMWKLKPYITRSIDDYKAKREAGQINPEFDTDSLGDLDTSGITEWGSKNPSDNKNH